jgi:ATP-binding cassette, subfamily B, bacterial PglK
MNLKKTFIELFFLLTINDRRNGLSLLFLVSFMGVLEAIGIASIMPFLAILGNPEIINESQLLNNLYEFCLNNQIWVKNVDEFLIFLGLSSFIFTLSVSIFRIFTIFKMNQFIEICRHNLSQNILKNYLNQSYEFFLNRHSAELTKNMLSEVDQVVIEVLRPVIEMISYIFVLLSISILLVWVNPIIAISAVLIMGLLYSGVYYSLRKKLAYYGDLSVSSNKQRYTSAIEALGGIKSIKLFGVEKLYLDSFETSSLKFTKSRFHYQIYNQMPKHLLEALAFGGIILLTVVLMWNHGGVSGTSLGQILPLLGIYALAAYRSQPALTAIYGGVTGLRYGAASINNLFFELRTNNQADTVSLDNTSSKIGKPEKNIKNEINDIVDFNSQKIYPKEKVNLVEITYKFPGGVKPVISNINLEIDVGSSIGIVGGSGAGKTTLLDIILGLLEPTDGYIQVDQTKINKKNKLGWQKNLGYVPQEMFLIDASIEENIAFGASKNNIDYDKVVESAKMAQIHNFIKNDLQYQYKTKVGERGVRLSGGQRQRISIARSLYNNPDILIFDEATSALDPVTEKSVLKTIRSLSGKKTVIIVAHKLTAVEDCDSVILLKNGSIKATGTFKEVEKVNKEFFI